MHGGARSAFPGHKSSDFGALGLGDNGEALAAVPQDDEGAQRVNSCETVPLSPTTSNEPPLDTPHLQLLAPANDESTDPARTIQRPPHPPQQHLVIVSNRLPVNLTWDAASRTWSLPVSSGGLVSALMGVGNHTTRWVGWPGECLPPSTERDAITADLRSRHSCAPVWIPKDTLDLYYNGFCNAVLWQLFHYVPVQMDFRLAEAHTLTQEWLAYHEANRLFAEAVAADYIDGDVVWIQDYHLMLLPEMLKQICPTMKVGFFLHTPFPSSEIYRTLPYREQLLRGVLKADLIGFHTYDYVRHFISSCTRILGLEGTPYGVEENGSLIRVAAFPIGIDPLKFSATLKDPGVADYIGRLKHRYSGLKVLLGVDRLDMIKGIPQKLLAFEKFLEEYEEFRSKVVLVQIAVPSRLDVPEYQQLRGQVHEIVGRINGRFGTLTHVPIHHLDRKLTFKELCALYAITDVALVTSLRDGMNLVSYEFVACQAENAGVLVLSEFAGAAQSLGAGSILVNPWNIDDMTSALYDAVRMSQQTRKRLWKSNFQHVSVHTAQTWGDHFIMELNETCATQQQQDTRHPPPLPLTDVATSSSAARKRLIVLGYNAALKTVSVAKTPRLRYESLNAVSGKAMVDEDILQMLRTLSQDSANVIVIVSGATTAKLCSAFLPLLGQSSVWLAAENGAFMRPPRQLWDTFSVQEGTEWICLYENLNFSWVKSVEQVFEYFSARTPRSVVETRETSVVWNYKYADYEFGKSQAQDMLQHLLTGSISNSSVDVVRGARSVEVRMHGVNKGVSMSRVIDSMAWLLGPHAVSFDFVLCIGHFMPRDESIFSYFEGKDIVNAEQGAAGPPGAQGSPPHPGHALDHINPYATSAPGAPPEGSALPSRLSPRPRGDNSRDGPAEARGELRDLRDGRDGSRMGEVGKMGSRVWTVDSFDDTGASVLAFNQSIGEERGAWNNSFHSVDTEVVGQQENGAMSGQLTIPVASPASATSPPMPGSPLEHGSSPSAPRRLSTSPQPPPGHNSLSSRAPSSHPGGASSRAGRRGPEATMRAFTRRGQSPPPYLSREQGNLHGDSPRGPSPFGATGGHFRHTSSWAAGDKRRSASSTPEHADRNLPDALAGDLGGSNGTPRGGSVQARVFPPRHLFTVTMGRSRSVARYCVDETKMVSRILECICNPQWPTSTRSQSGGPSTLCTPLPSVHLDWPPPPAVAAATTAAAAGVNATSAADTCCRPTNSGGRDGDAIGAAQPQNNNADRGQGEAAVHVDATAAPQGAVHPTAIAALVSACSTYDSLASLPAAHSSSHHNMLGRLSSQGPPVATLAEVPPAPPAPGPTSSTPTHSSPGGAAGSAAATSAAVPRSTAAADISPHSSAQLPAVAPSSPPSQPANDGAAPPRGLSIGGGVRSSSMSNLASSVSQPPASPATLAGGAHDHLAMHGPPRLTMPLEGPTGAPVDGRGAAGVPAGPAVDARSTLFDAMGRPVPLAQALSAATAELPPVAAERPWSRHRSMRGATPTRSVTCFEPTYEPERRPGRGTEHVLAGSMPSIRSESDLSLLAAPPALRVASLDLPAYRSVMRPPGSSGYMGPRLHSLSHFAPADDSGDSLDTVPAGGFPPHRSGALTARDRSSSSLGFGFGPSVHAPLVAAPATNPRRQSYSTGALYWGSSQPLQEGASVPSRGCTSVDSFHTSSTSRPSGSARSAPNLPEPSEVSRSAGELGGERETKVLECVSSFAIPDLQREGSFPVPDF